MNEQSNDSSVSLCPRETIIFEPSLVVLANLITSLPDGLSFGCNPKLALISQSLDNRYKNRLCSLIAHEF